MVDLESLLSEINNGPHNAPGPIGKGAMLSTIAMVTYNMIIEIIIPLVLGWTVLTTAGWCVWYYLGWGKTTYTVQVSFDDNQAPNSDINWLSKLIRLPKTFLEILLECLVFQLKFIAKIFCAVFLKSVKVMRLLPRSILFFTSESFSRNIDRINPRVDGALHRLLSYLSDANWRGVPNKVEDDASTTEEVPATTEKDDWEALKQCSEDQYVPLVS